MGTVDYEAAGGAARITLSSPDDGNPMGPQLFDDLLASVRRARSDDAHVVLLRAEGRFFSVGGDAKPSIKGRAESDAGVRRRPLTSAGIHVPSLGKALKSGSLNGSGSNGSASYAAAGKNGHGNFRPY